MSGVSGKLVKGSLWISLSRAIVNFLAVASTFVLARALTPNDFGIVALGTTILMIVTTVTDLSLAQALVRHPEPGESHFSAAFTLNAARGLLLFALFAAAAWPAAAFYGDRRLIGIMLALGGSVFLSGLTNPRRVMLQRQLVFHQEFILNVAQKLAGVIVSIVIAVIFHSYWALVIGTLVTQATNVAVSYTVLPFRPRILFAHMRELLSFSVWLTAGQIVNTLNWRFDYLLIGKLLGGGALGFYSVGGNLAQAPTRETTAPLTQTIFPGFARIANEPARLAAAYQRAQALVTAVALPMGFGVAMVADPLIRLTMGEKWLPVILIVQALSAVFALQTLGSLVQPLAMARNETKLLFVRNAQMLALRVPVIIAGIMIDGLRGLILARVLTGLASVPVNMALVRRLTGVSMTRQIAANGRALAGVAAMAAGTLAVTPLLPPRHDAWSLIVEIGLLGAFGMVLYLGTTTLLWRIAGRPAGPEQEITGMARAAAARLPSAKRRVPQEHE